MENVVTWLQTLNPTLAVFAATLGFFSVLENFTRLKVWSWMLGRIGNLLNAGVTGRLDKLEQTVTEVKGDVDMNRFKACKEQILDFAGGIMNGKTNTREQYAHLLEIVDEYNNKYADKHNGELKQTISFIEDEYKTFCHASAVDGRAKNKKQSTD